MIEFFFDGSCEPNPGGTAGYGAEIYEWEVSWDDRRLLHQISGSIPPGATSNNVAEYRALIAALEWLLERGHADSPVMARGDSMLVIKQMWGWRGQRWGIKAGLYAADARRAKILIGRFSRLRGTWVPRGSNAGADGLSRPKEVLEARKAAPRRKPQPASMAYIDEKQRASDLQRLAEIEKASKEFARPKRKKRKRKLRFQGDRP